MVFKVSPSVKQAIQRFVAPNGWEIVSLEGRMEVRNVANNARKWYCQVDHCNYCASTSSQKTHGSYSHAITHLRNKHEIRSKRSLRRQENREQIEDDLNKLMGSNLYNNNIKLDTRIYHRIVDYRVNASLKRC